MMIAGQFDEALKETTSTQAVAVQAAQIAGLHAFQTITIIKLSTAPRHSEETSSQLQGHTESGIHPQQGEIQVDPDRVPGLGP